MNIRIPPFVGCLVLAVSQLSTALFAQGQIDLPPEPPVVRIDATRPVAEEDSAPLERLPLVGEFTISRTGSVTSSLPVFLQVSGSATSGKDYKPLPFLVSIPAGATSAAVRVEAIPDDEREGVESVVASVSNCPPDTDPRLGIPCYLFDIDPAHASAIVYVRDDSTQSRPSLVITRPADGARFERGQLISIEAVAVDPEGYIPEIAFFDGDRKIGESRIDFIRAPDPGTPIHHTFDWRDVEPGPHVLTARAKTSSGAGVSSAPVRITVGAGTDSNQPPAVVIVRPASGRTFPINEPIIIAAEARDVDGYVPKAEFFADGRKLGEVSLNFLVPPPPGEKQSFEFAWRMPSAGAHRLTVRATDNLGRSSLSAPIEILVASDDALPVVTVITRDSFASEPGPSATAVLNTAAFIIRRSGPTNASLTVNYSMDGAAENGADYEKLSGLVTIAAGQRAATILVRPLADNVSESYESVVLQLQPPRADGSRYLVGRPARGLAVISDRPWDRLIGVNSCQRLDRDCTLVAFDVESGFDYRIEVSDDLRVWETVGVQTANEPVLLFTEDDLVTHVRRFYRIAPEPTAVE